MRSSSSQIKTGVGSFTTASNMIRPMTGDRFSFFGPRRRFISRCASQTATTYRPPNAQPVTTPVRFRPAIAPDAAMSTPVQSHSTMCRLAWLLSVAIIVIAPLKKDYLPPGSGFFPGGCAASIDILRKNARIYGFLLQNRPHPLFPNFSSPVRDDTRAHSLFSSFFCFITCHAP